MGTPGFLPSWWLQHDTPTAYLPFYSPLVRSKATPKAYEVTCAVGECPRIPYPDEDLVGKVCVGSIGRIGVVSCQQLLSWGLSWVGMSFDGKGVWASSKPVVVAESVDEFRAYCMERFGGKLSHLG